MIKCYRRAVRRCRSVNQINALHIALANRITPSELVALRNAQGPWFALRTLAQQGRHLLSPLTRLWGVETTPAELRDRWLRRLLGLYAQAGKPQPETYRRRKLSRHLSLYSAGGARHDKTLLICYVGSSQRPFLPTPVFLQHLDSDRADVLMVGYPRGKGHRHGLPELGDTLEETIDKLPGLAEIGAYRRCAAMGTSGGGTPALLTALRLELAAALSAGGGSPNDPRWTTALGEEVGALARRYAAAATQPPRVVLAFGVDAQKDIVAARAFAECVPCELRPIRDRRHRAPHNLFQPLLQRRLLQAFLESTVM